jgi:hypothetical protein
MQFKEYFIRNFVLPKVITSNEPGRITSYSTSRYGPGRSMFRLCYGFEDLFVALQVASTKELGRVKSEELWYRIGKTFGMRHLSFSGKSKIPKMLIPDVLTFIFRGFQSSGFSVAERIEYDPAERSLVLTGPDNAICRKTGQGEVSAGVVSAIMSRLLAEDIEATKVSCSKRGKYCRIVSNRDIPVKHKVEDLERYLPKDGYQLNFRDMAYQGTYDSFEKLVEFKRIVFKGNRYFLSAYGLIYIEVGFFDIIYMIYDEYGLADVYDRTVRDSAARIVRELSKQTEDRRRYVCNLLSALGWGIPSISDTGKGHTVTILSPPYSGIGFHYLPQFMCGAVSALGGRKEVLERVRFDPISNSLRMITRFSRNPTQGRIADVK